jgi:hypothetical protein
MYKSLLTEYGIPWVINRYLYSVKLRMMRTIPITENLFEKKIEIKRIDIFHVDTIKIEIFLNYISDGDKKEIIQMANNAVEGRIKAFSSIELDYGSPIKWHINPMTNVEVDKDIKWYKIPDFDSVRGDIKTVWEASRFTHFFYLTRAYMITKDVKYYKAFSTQINDWIEQNPYSYGPNYKCGQEATLRMINALIAYSVFKDYGLITKEDEVNLKKIVEGGYKKVISNFFYAYKCIKNNHTLSEITGLIIGAWCSKDQKRLKKAYELFDKEIKLQFKSDGGYIQNSVNYQRFALQMMEFILRISEASNCEILDDSKQLILKSAHQMYQIQDETGDVPNRGANDGTLIFPVTSCDYRDFRSTINAISYLITGYRLYDFGMYDEEILWFSEDDLIDSQIKRIPRESSSFEISGLFTIRHKNGFLMIVLRDIDTRPGQMDQLHMDLWHKNLNILCDAGSYSYASEIGKNLTLTAAHNTSQVDNREQMNKKGPFLVYDWSKAKNVRHADTMFSGTMLSKNGYEHTRNIRLFDNSYEIIDLICGNGDTCYLRFHTPCQINKRKNNIELLKDGNVVAVFESDGDIEIKKSYRSLYYLKKEEIYEIVISKKINNSLCSFKTIVGLKQ